MSLSWKKETINYAKQPLVAVVFNEDILLTYGDLRQISDSTRNYTSFNVNFHPLFASESYHKFGKTKWGSSEHDSSLFLSLFRLHPSAVRQSLYFS